MSGTRLENDPVFETVAGNARGVLENRSRIRRFERGAMIYREGDPPNGLFKLISGEVRLISYPSPARELVNLVVGPGHWFGELSVLDGKPRPHNAVCTEPGSLLQIPMAAIAVSAQLDPLIFRSIALIGCAHQRSALRFIGDYVGKSSRARLCALLLTMVEGTAEREGGGRIFRMGQTELAARVGLSRQHLNVLLQDFKEQGLIATSYGCIEVLAPDRLRCLADVEA